MPYFDFRTNFFTLQIFINFEIKTKIWTIFFKPKLKYFHVENHK